MTELVRVRVGGVEKNMGRTLAEASDDVTILDEPTHKPDGSHRPTTRANGRPMKPKTSVAEAAKKKSAAEVAAGDDTNKENPE